MPRPGIPELNDAFERHYHYRGRMTQRVRWLLDQCVRGLELRNALVDNEVIVNERIVEYALVFRALAQQPLGVTVLDVGCFGSRLPIQLASLGYEVREFRRVLKPGGRLLLSVPYGERSCNKTFRTYDWDGLVELIGPGLQITQTSFFRRHQTGWKPSDAVALASVRSTTLPVNGVVFVDAQRSPAEAR